MPPLKHNSVRDGLSDSDRFSDISSSSPSLLLSEKQQFVPNARINISQSTKRELDSNSVKKIADNLPGFSDWRRPPQSPPPSSSSATSSPGSTGDERLPTPATRRIPKKQQRHRNSSTTTTTSEYSVIDYSNMKDYVSFTPNNSNSQQRNIRDIECDILSQPQPQVTTTNTASNKSATTCRTGNNNSGGNDSQSPHQHQLAVVSSTSPPPPPPIRKQQQRYTKPDGPKPDPQPDLRVVPRKTSSSYYSDSSSSNPSSNSQQHTSSTTNRRRTSIESIGEQPSISTTNTEQTKKFNNTKEATMYKYKLLYETMLLEVAEKEQKNSSSSNSWVELGEDVINENTITTSTANNNTIVEHHNSSIANKSAFHVSNSSSMNASSPTPSSHLAITKQTSLYSNASNNITPSSNGSSGKVNIPKTPTCTLVVDEMIDGLEVEEIMLDNNEDDENDDETAMNHHQSKTNQIDKKLGNSERRNQKKKKKKSRHADPSSSTDKRGSKNGSSSRENLNRSSRGRSRGSGMIQRQSSMDEIVSIASYKSSNSTSSRRSERSDRSSRSGRSSRSMSSHRSNRSNDGGRKSRRSRSRSGSSPSRRLSESSSSSKLEDDTQQDTSFPNNTEELSNKKHKSSVFSKIKKFATKVKDTLDELGGGIHKYKLNERARYRVMKVPKKCRRLYDEDTRTVEVEIVVVHVDAVLEMPYYTIELPDGQRKQTNYDNLMTLAEYKKIKAANQRSYYDDNGQECLERGRSSSRLLRFPSHSRSRSSKEENEEEKKKKKKKERRPSSSRRSPSQQRRHRGSRSSSRGSREDDEERYLSSSQRSLKSNTSQRSSKSNNSTTSTRDRDGSRGGEGGGGRLRSNSSSGDGIIIPSSLTDSHRRQQRQHQQRLGGRPRSPSPVSKHREEKEPEEGEDHASVSDHTHRTTGTTNTRKQHNLSNTKVYV